MNALNIDEIIVAHEAATQGPWYEGFIDNDGEGPIPPEPSGEIFTASEHEHDQEICTCRTNDADAQFIAKSRQWVPDLAAEVIRLREELTAYKCVKAYWDSLYGEGLEVANRHKNGDTEPFDSFWQSAEEEFNNSAGDGGATDEK